MRIVVNIMRLFVVLAMREKYQKPLTSKEAIIVTRLTNEILSEE